MTLVEVIGGLGLLATLLVTLLLARGRYTRQAALADRRLQAVSAADAMLTAWHQDPASISRGSIGVVPSDGTLTWRTQVVANPVVNQFDAQVVRLEILDNRRQGATSSVLTSVEFVVDSGATPAINTKRELSNKKRPNRK